MLTLRPYQLSLAAQGLAILRRAGLVYIAAEPRIGKTHIALEIARQYGAQKVLVLTKKIARASIEADYKAAEHYKNYTIFVTNMEQLGKFHGSWDLIIIDEAHQLKAYPLASLRTKYLMAHVKDTPVIFLSGTPSPEGYSGMYHQLAISSHSPWSHYKNFYHWACDYVLVRQVRRGLYTINDYSDAKSEKIKADIAPFMLSFSQAEAGFKCKVAEHFHEVDIPLIPILIKKMFRERVLRLPAMNGSHEITRIADTPAALMNCLHQLSGCSLICDTETRILSLAKAEYIRDTFAGRIAVYYKYIAEKEILKMIFPTSTEIPEEFQEGKCSVFISQIQSGREGIALCKADALVFYSIDYAAVSYLQTIARIQDLTRETTADIHWIFVKGGIEKTIYSCVTNKLNFTYSFFRKQGAIC